MKSERFSFLFPRCSLIYLKSQIKLYVRTIISINNIKASKKLSSKNAPPNILYINLQRQNHHIKVTSSNYHNTPLLHQYLQPF